MKKFQIIDENVIRTEWYHYQDTVPDSKTLNVFIASMTTCWARLSLFKVLELVSDRPLHYDTDSVIYVNRPATPKPPG